MSRKGDTRESFMLLVKEVLKQAVTVNDGLAAMAQTLNLQQEHSMHRELSDSVVTVLKDTTENLRLFADVFEAHVKYVQKSTERHTRTSRGNQEPIRGSEVAEAEKGSKPPLIPRRAESKARPLSKQGMRVVTLKEPQIFVSSVFNDHYSARLQQGDSWEVIATQKIEYNAEGRRRLETITNKILTKVAKKEVNALKLVPFQRTGQRVPVRKPVAAKVRPASVAEEIKKSVGAEAKKRVLPREDSLVGNQPELAPGISTAVLRKRAEIRKTEQQILDMLNAQRNVDHAGTPIPSSRRSSGQSCGSKMSIDEPKMEDSTVALSVPAPTTSSIELSLIHI